MKFNFLPPVAVSLIVLLSACGSETETAKKQESLIINAPSNLTFGDSSAELTANGGSGKGELTYSVGSSTGCVLAGPILSVSDASGTCLVNVTKAADDSYSAATSADATVLLFTPIYVQPIPNLPKDFIKGADISALLEVEENGGVYYDKAGQEADVFKILADNGVNWARLRLWNDPYDVSWIKEVTGYDVQGASGAGTNDLPRTIIMAKRAKAAGMKLLLDFHYSDFWAHPGQQFMPDAWVGLSERDVEQALYDFTYDSLIEMQNHGVFPEMVQIGNEINSGLVAPQGNGVTSANAIALLKQGSKAVRDAQLIANVDSKIMIHLANATDYGLFEWAFDAFTEADLDYDIIGASYYSYWHGSLADVQSSLDAITARYNKEVIIVETAYGFTTEEGHGGGNIFGEQHVLDGGYAASVLGQATAIRDVMNVVAQVPNNLGAGVFYWEPTWLAVGNTGWVAGGPNEWNNQAMFDYDGKVLDSMEVFWRVHEDKVVAAPSIVSALESEIIFEQGDDVDLPSHAKAFFSDDAYRDIEVVWINGGIVNTDGAGEYTLEGTLANSDVTVTGNVTVVATVAGILVNSGFETGEIEPWVISEGTADLALANSPGEAYSGNWALHFYSLNPQIQSVTQTVNDVPNGIYNVSAWFMGESTGSSNSMLSATSGTSTIDTPIIFNGWLNWTEMTFDIEVTNNTLTVTADLDEASGSWGNIDLFRVELISE